MLSTQRWQINQLFKSLSETLDISESRFLEAKERFEALGNWLDRDESIISGFKPVIYPQGSFSLGTVVKPLTGQEEYDIDLVSELNWDKTKTTQKNLKDIVGQEIKGYAKANNMHSPPAEGRRCWTLHYAEGAQFHLDILPAIPDEDFRQKLLEQRVSRELTYGGIAITDNTLPNYARLDLDWLKSNPKGYVAWFRKQMEVQLFARKQLLAESMRAKVEEVPEYKVKTPLQMSVQLLKRHRDIMFENDPDDKPISIIITTLSAHAYQNEAELVEALTNIVQGMPENIKMVDGIPWVANPVNPKENFADKWQEYPRRRIKFEKWLKQVQFDLEKILRKDSLKSMGEYLKPRFGEEFVSKTLNKLSGNDVSKEPSPQGMTPVSRLLSLFGVSHREKPKWPVNTTSGNVYITGRASCKGFRPWETKSNSSPLPKHYSLRFEARTDIHRPFKVYWQVVNTGEEAATDNCLRGGFYQGLAERGDLVRKEGTLYKGTHWIECFIVKNDECVARSGEFIVNIK